MTPPLLGEPRAFAALTSEAASNPYGACPRRESGRPAGGREPWAIAVAKHMRPGEDGRSDGRWMRFQSFTHLLYEEEFVHPNIAGSLIKILVYLKLS